MVLGTQDIQMNQRPFCPQSALGDSHEGPWYKHKYSESMEKYDSF